jgi:hypothetical protein
MKSGLSAYQATLLFLHLWALERMRTAQAKAIAREAYVYSRPLGSGAAGAAYH